jgi:hypothetical protein
MPVLVEEQEAPAGRLVLPAGFASLDGSDDAAASDDKAGKEGKAGGRLAEVSGLARGGARYPLDNEGISALAA